jgi:uncharacterized membrane protein YbaN (DUF454 family)
MPNKQIAQSFFAVPVADLRKQVEALSSVILHQRNLNRIVRDFERGRNISVSEIIVKMCPILFIHCRNNAFIVIYQTENYRSLL